MTNYAKLKYAAMTVKHNWYMRRYRLRLRAMALGVEIGYSNWFAVRPGNASAARLAEMVAECRRMVSTIHKGVYPPSVKQQAVNEYLKRQEAQFMGLVLSGRN